MIPQGNNWRILLNEGVIYQRHGWRSLFLKKTSFLFNIRHNSNQSLEWYTQCKIIKTHKPRGLIYFIFFTIVSLLTFGRWLIDIVHVEDFISKQHMNKIYKFLIAQRFHRLSKFFFFNTCSYLYIEGPNEINMIHKLYISTISFKYGIKVMHQVVLNPTGCT